ncbi:MAG: hypothetical protein SFZ02_18830 [bacterium]|nr:hypothetical protein [bacterium]
MTTLFQRGLSENLANTTKSLLNQQTDFLSEYTVNSPRAVGDAIQSLLEKQFGQILGDIAKNYSSAFARRAMADIAFEDTYENFYLVDVKTHRLNTNFNMPNLTSVERIARLYEDDKNVFSILWVSYELQDFHVEVKGVRFFPIEALSGKCLTIGALGWGQIQIANANKIILNPEYTRKTWMLDLCDHVLSFYPREIGKIQERIIHFEHIRAKWESRL